MTYRLKTQDRDEANDNQERIRIHAQTLTQVGPCEQDRNEERDGREGEENRVREGAQDDNAYVHEAVLHDGIRSESCQKKG